MHGCDVMINKEIYNKICEEEEKENEIMDNVIFDTYLDAYGKEEVDIIFEDEVKEEEGGDWYCRASGGGFSSASDYWNYILG